MSDELSRFGTGERGTIKIERPTYEAKPVINEAVLDRDLECGEWAWKDGVLVPFSEEKKKELHAVIADEIEPTEYLGSDKFGEIYTSKKKLEERTHRDGYFIPSMDERRRMKRLADYNPKFDADDDYRRQMREDWEKAEAQVRVGEVEFTEQEKQQCLEEERNYKKYRMRRKAQGY